MGKTRPPGRRRPAVAKTPLPPPEPDSPQKLLMLSLELAVPLWIERHRPATDEQRTARARELVPVIASRGDQILFHGSVKGRTAEAFNALAEALAVLSFAPGGVTFEGRHWETSPPRRERLFPAD